MIIDVPFLSIAYLLELISFFWEWMYSITFAGVPLPMLIVFLFMFCCFYRFIVAPFFSGGVSVTASDSVKMAGNAINSANKHNIRHQSEIRYKTNIRNL